MRSIGRYTGECNTALVVTPTLPLAWGMFCGTSVDFESVSRVRVSSMNFTIFSRTPHLLVRPFSCHNNYRRAPVLHLLLGNVNSASGLTALRTSRASTVAPSSRLRPDQCRKPPRHGPGLSQMPTKKVLPGKQRVPPGERASVGSARA